MLTQVYKVEGEKFFMPMLYAIKSLKGAKRQYSVTDLKALLYLGIEKVQFVHYGNKF